MCDKINIKSQAELFRKINQVIPLSVNRISIDIDIMVKIFIEKEQTMGKYSCVNQLGFVVPDLKEAMRLYGKIYGVKRWYHPINKPVGESYFEGKPYNDPEFDIAIGYCGKTEIELIHVGKVDNLYSRFLKERPAGGLHHISFFVKDLDAWIEEYRQMGFELSQNGVTNGRSTKCRYAYMTRPEQGLGCIVEAAEMNMGKITMGSRGAFSMWLGLFTGDTKRWRIK